MLVNYCLSTQLHTYLNDHLTCKANNLLLHWSLSAFLHWPEIFSGSWAHEVCYPEKIKCIQKKERTMKVQRWETNQEIQRNRTTVILNWTLVVLLPIKVEFWQRQEINHTHKKPSIASPHILSHFSHVHNLVTDRQKWGKFQMMSDHNKKGTLPLPCTVHHIHILTTTLDGTFLLSSYYILTVKL